MTTLVTFGESMLRLSPPRGQRLSRVDHLDVHVGGAESNVAVAASAFGIDAAWISALPATRLGERIVHELRGEGVDAVVNWTDDGRVGTYYFERGGPPRGGTVLYDRTATPIRTVSPDDLPMDRVRAAEWFFTSGITPALSDRLATTTQQVLEAATESGVSTALDLNYRASLWPPAVARETVSRLFPHVEILFVAERDARRVLDLDGSPETVARTLADRHGFETVVLTRSAEGALAVQDDTCYEQAAYETETVDPVGSGDAFVGGFFGQWLSGGSIDDALDYAAATAAIKRTLHGDVVVTSPSEVEAIIDETSRLTR